MSTTAVRSGARRAEPGGGGRTPTGRAWRRRSIVAATVVAATVLGVLALTDGSDEPAAPALSRPVPPEYRVVYEVRETAGEAPVVTAEVVEVRRPFDARVETWAGSRPGDKLLSVTVTNREYFWHVQQGGKVEFGVPRQPGTAHRDASRTALRDAADQGVVDELGEARVLGHRCTRYAYRETRPSPLSSATARDRVESCVTAGGIVLREVWRHEGRPVLSWQAVEVDTEPRLRDERFLIGRVPDPSRESESASALRAQAVREGNQLEMPVATPRLPRGFVADRRATVFVAGGSGLGSRNSYFELWRREHEVVVIEQGRTESDAPPWPETDGSSIDLSGFASSRLVFFPDHVELRSVLDDADPEELLRFVIVRAPSLALARHVAEGLEFGE